MYQRLLYLPIDTELSSGHGLLSVGMSEHACFDDSHQDINWSLFPLLLLWEFNPYLSFSFMVSLLLTSNHKILILVQLRSSMGGVDAQDWGGEQTSIDLLLLIYISFLPEVIYNLSYDTYHSGVIYPRGSSTVLLYSSASLSLHYIDCAEEAEWSIARYVHLARRRFDTV